MTEAVKIFNKKDVSYYLEAARFEANQSSCLRSQCGSVIVKEGKVIGKGFNSPPKNQKLHQCRKESLPQNFKSDRTCCVHAEQRAIMDALAKNPDKIQGSILYFVRLDDNGKIKPSGDPYCTICSKMALDVGVSRFVLVQKDAIRAFDTDYYNELSFACQP